MAGYNQDDIEEMKIRDGLTLHEHRKAVLREYCSENDLDYVKPIVLVACKDTDHAKKIRALIDSDDFQGGKYKGKVIEIHSKQTGEESEENIRLLLSIESASNPVEIVLHVYKLKEGWDVNNLFTIIPLNAAKSDILAMQTIGRGLRLPFGEQTGNEDLDSLDIVAHDHYRELVDEIKSSDIFRYRDLDKATVEPSESVGVSATVDDGQLSLLDFAITASGVKSFAEVSNPKTQLEIYQEYVKNFMAAQKKDKNEDPGQMTLFDLHPEMLSGDSAKTTAPAQEQPQAATSGKPGKQPLTKDEFVKAVSEYSAKAISVPKILVQTTSEVKFNRFEVKRTIADFEVAMAKIERFDAINQQLLSVVDAQILEVNDAMNTLACMLLDSISELSYDDADFVIDVVEQYLSQIPGDEENKRRIVRRYEAAFAYAMDVLREYPSCDMLAYGFAASLLGGLELAPPAQGRETFEAELDSLLERAAGAGDAGVRVPAQQLLINRCIQKKDTARAEALLGQLPQATFEPALIRASIHRAKGEDGQAARLLEGFLAQSAANLQEALMQLSEIALKEGDSQAACTIAHTAQEVFRLLGLWGPSLVTPMLQLNAQKRDVPGTLACLEEFLAALQQPWQANATPLYRHVPAKNADFGPNFAAMIARVLRTDKDFAFLHGEPGFEAILQQFEQAAACGQRAAEPVEM